MIFTKSESFKRVPWFSFSEWHQVYQQIYSNNNEEQIKGYENLLVWKARMPKLPVGVDCTLALIHVCLRDREWSFKINNGELSMSYENDLCLLYSTTIMKFLNHISNIGHTKQTSMFRIAKQLEIPEWIVNLRHDAAHGHELPSIDLFRIAVNTLLTWLHNEYWIVEVQELEKEFIKDLESTDSEDQSVDDIINFIELWIAVGLYNIADNFSVSNLPDKQLQDTLNELRLFAKKSKRYSDANKYENIKNQNDYCLSTAKFYLLNEINSFLSNRKTSFDATPMVLSVIINSEAFLPTNEFLQLFLYKSNLKNNWDQTQLPKAMIKFWEPFIVMLHEREILDLLVFKLIEFINSNNVDRGTREKKLYAALWIKSIAQGLLKLRIAQREMQVLENSFNNYNKKLTPKMLELKLKEKVNCLNPKLQHGLWLDIMSDVPKIFTEMHFVENFITNPNELTLEFIEPLLDLVIPRIEVEVKHKLLNLIGIYTGKQSLFFKTISNGEENVIYTEKDLIEKSGGKFLNSFNGNDEINEEIMVDEFNLADKNERNHSWKLSEESDNTNWVLSEFGILPWQSDSLEILKSKENISSKIFHSPISSTINIIPGFIDRKNMITNSRVNWEDVLRKKQRRKRKKLNINTDIVINKAIRIVKNKSN